MEAGSDLDDIVAEKVMGLEVFECGYYGEDETPRMVELHDWLDKVGIESVGTYFIDVKADKWEEAGHFRPSTVMSDAIKMAKKFDTFMFGISGSDDPRSNGKLGVWACVIKDGVEHHFTDLGTNDVEKLPRVICMAALKAMGCTV